MSTSTAITTNSAPLIMSFAKRRFGAFKWHPEANFCQRFLTTHAAIYNTLYTQRHVISRPTLRRFRSDAGAVIKLTALFIDIWSRAFNRHDDQRNGRGT